MSNDENSTSLPSAAGDSTNNNNNTSSSSRSRELPNNDNNQNQQQHDDRDELLLAAEEAAEEDEHEHDMVMPGFRFHPTEEELVEFYLRRKVEGKRFNVELITFLDLYRYDPWELPAMAAIGEKEWFFYVPRDRKYRNGDRPNRVTTSGYWKATGADRMIRTESSRSIGLKKTLVFYSGKAPKGVRTSWIMNEYRLPHHDTQRYQKTEISLCRVYKRAGVEDHHGGPSSLPRSLPSTSIRPHQHQHQHHLGASSSSSSKKHHRHHHQQQQHQQQLPQPSSHDDHASTQHQLLLQPFNTQVMMMSDVDNNTTCTTTTTATTTPDSIGLISNMATSLGLPTLLPARQQEEVDHNDDDDNNNNNNNTLSALDDLHRLVNYQHHHQQYYTRLLQHQQHQHQNIDHHPSYHNQHQLQHMMLFPPTPPQSQQIVLPSTTSLQIWDWNPVVPPPQHQHQNDQLQGHGSDRGDHHHGQPPPHYDDDINPFK
ncbi:NAC domain-containing protein 35 [Linum perenne]